MGNRIHHHLEYMKFVSVGWLGDIGFREVYGLIKCWGQVWNQDKFAYGDKLRGVNLRIWNLAHVYTHGKTTENELVLWMTTAEYLNGLFLCWNYLEISEG